MATIRKNNARTNLEEGVAPFAGVKMAPDRSGLLFDFTVSRSRTMSETK